MLYCLIDIFIIFPGNGVDKVMLMRYDLSKQASLSAPIFGNNINKAHSER